MEIVGTREAFLQLLSKRGIYKQLGVDRSTVSNWKSGNQGLTIDKMEKVLLQSGASVLVEKTWDVPIPTTDNTEI